MGKGHRDNYNARKKRGPAAIEKRKKRRAESSKPRCRICGTRTRRKKLLAGVCPLCTQRKIENTGVPY